LVVFENEALLLQLMKGISIGEHMNNNMKLLADITNIDEMIKDEDNVLILLSSLPDKSMKPSF